MESDDDPIEIKKSASRNNGMAKAFLMLGTSAVPRGMGAVNMHEGGNNGADPGKSDDSGMVDIA